MTGSGSMAAAAGLMISRSKDGNVGGTRCPGVAGKGVAHGRHDPPRRVLLRDGSPEARRGGGPARRAAAGRRQSPGVLRLPERPRRAGRLRAGRRRDLQGGLEEGQVEGQGPQEGAHGDGRRPAGRGGGHHEDAGRRPHQRRRGRRGVRGGGTLRGDLVDESHLDRPRRPSAGGRVMSQRLALHTWTLDVSPLADALRIAKATGWDGVELRRIDFKRAEEAGRPADSVLDQVRASGLPVACVGVEFGWMWADGAEKTRLLTVFDEQARRAAALGCTTMMSPVDKGRGDVARAAAGVREVGDIAQRHGVRLAVEFNSQCDQIHTLERVRAIMARASHPAGGLLLDTCHLGRSGATLKAVEDVAPSEIAYVQFSDPPRTGLEPGKELDRLPPGQGSYPFREFFAIVAAKGYGGFASYEAPNERTWKRDATEIAREAIEATRAVLPRCATTTRRTSARPRLRRTASTGAARHA